MTRLLPEGFARGPLQGRNVIGEVTEALHAFLLGGWSADAPPPRIEEDLSFVPKDREEILYVYMYRASQNTALLNSKRWRPARFTVNGSDGEAEVYYERPPLYLDLHYLVAVHSRFRSDAERLLGWVLLRLHEATHLMYRPRRYLLPDGREIDSTGRAWQADADGEDVIMEKVGLALSDDLTIGDAINFFTIHEAPFRPYVTYKARCAMEGALLSAPPTLVRAERLESSEEAPPSHERSGGRLGAPAGRPAPRTPPIGPPGRDVRPLGDDGTTSED